MDTVRVILGLQRIVPPVSAPLCERLDSSSPLIFRLATNTHTGTFMPEFAHLMSNSHSVNGLVRLDEIYIIYIYRVEDNGPPYTQCSWWFLVVDNNLASLKWKSAHLIQDLQAQHFPHEMNKVNGHKSRVPRWHFLFLLSCKVMNLG